MDWFNIRAWVWMLEGSTAACRGFRESRICYLLLLGCFVRFLRGIVHGTRRQLVCADEQGGRLYLWIGDL